jgi:phosphoribosylformimino-5-aminoimidazole carboxamide ribotide isomerase
MKIIPAIDIIAGQCVRLTQGDYTSKTIYYDKPLEVAKRFEDAGISQLHLVDLDGAKAKHIVNYKILELLCSKTNLKIDFGGGLKSNDDVRIAFDCGASQITGGSIAVKNPIVFESWIKTYGSEKIILGADCLNENIAIQGWQQNSSLKVLPFIDDYYTKGVQTVICTDISRDGMLKGPSISLYTSILNQNPALDLIASGGVSSLGDLKELNKIGCNGVIIGKAIYEGRISLKALEQFQLNNQ